MLLSPVSVLSKPTEAGSSQCHSRCMFLIDSEEDLKKWRKKKQFLQKLRQFVSGFLFAIVHIQQQRVDDDEWRYLKDTQTVEITIRTIERLLNCRFASLAHREEESLKNYSVNLISLYANKEREKKRNSKDKQTNIELTRARDDIVCWCLEGAEPVRGNLSKNIYIPYTTAQFHCECYCWFACCWLFAWLTLNVDSKQCSHVAPAIRTFFFLFQWTHNITISLQSRERSFDKVSF